LEGLLGVPEPKAAVDCFYRVIRSGMGITGQELHWSHTMHRGLVKKGRPIQEGLAGWRGQQWGLSRPELALFPLKNNKQ